MSGLVLLTTVKYLLLNYSYYWLHQHVQFFKLTLFAFPAQDIQPLENGSGCCLPGVWKHNEIYVILVMVVIVDFLPVNGFLKNENLSGEIVVSDVNCQGVWRPQVGAVYILHRCVDFSIKFGNISFVIEDYAVVTADSVGRIGLTGSISCWIRGIDELHPNTHYK